MLNLAKSDMCSIYNYIVENPLIMDIFPAQYFVVEQYPEGIPDEFISEPCIGLFEHKGKSGAILVLKDTNIIEVLREVLNQKRRLHAFEVPSVYDFLNLDIDINISGKRLLTIYYQACIISDLLKIETPPVHIIKMEETGSTATYFDDAGNLFGNIVSISLFGLSGMIHTLAHELRHVWQADRQDFYQDYHTEQEIGYYAYLIQPEEIDANAYANKYVASIGYDLQVLSRTVYANNIKPSVKQLMDGLICSRMDEINLEETA